MAAKEPFLLKARASYQFISLVQGFAILTDQLIYSIVIPVLPFQLERLNYTGVSGLVGFLLFAFSGGLALSTFPVAIFSEKYNDRKSPMIAGAIILICSQIMLMEAPKYWVMIIARVLQGFGSTMVWVVGLALLCDSTPPDRIGQQVGLAMTGFSIGFLIGPPVAGALFEAFGFRGPFIFGICVIVFDLILRLFIIERKTAIKHGFDPAAAKAVGMGSNGVAEISKPDSQITDEQRDSQNAQSNSDSHDVAEKSQSSSQLEEGNSDSQTMEEKLEEPSEEKGRKMLPFLSVLARLLRSPRALVAFLIPFMYALTYSSQEPALPLHLQRVWGLGSAKVGLVYLAAALPSILSIPVTGYFTDRIGQGWLVILALGLSVPWEVITIVEGPLALFIVAFALQNFFASGGMSPILVEMGAVAESIEGIGYAHVYAVFNLSYGIGTTVGPIVGGQVFQHLRKGWEAIVLICTGMIILCVILAFCFVGDVPLIVRMRKQANSQKEARGGREDSQERV